MENLTTEHTHKLLKLLQRKLAGIPSGHLPTLTLADIIGQAPKALSLPNIPPDLQLPFLLTNRTLINASSGLAIKDDSIQHLDVTRAIFFYRLDEVHQFQRYHDSHRWNVAVCLGLLTVPKTTSDPYVRDAVYFTPAARRFVISYLGAVLEHHNTPAKFHARENFIRLWKDSRYDFFTFGSGQKKLLKTYMKHLSAAWNQELDRIKGLLGLDEYERRVAKFVGTIIPGRVDHRAQAKTQVFESNEDIKMSNDTLLAALETPLDAVSAVKRSEVNTLAVELGKPREAVNILKSCDPRIVLHHLMQIFPPEDEADEDYWGNAHINLTTGLCTR